MNVAQVRVLNGTASMDLRANMIEVVRSDAGCNLTMVHILPPEKTGVVFDPVLLGRIWLPAPVTIVDALAGDGQNWTCESGAVRVVIRPYKEEHIWLDGAFTDPAAVADQPLRRLYDELRLCRFSLAAHHRLLRGTANEPIASTHEVVLGVMRDRIELIEKRIAAAKRKQP